MKLSVFGSSSAGNGYALEFDNGKILLIEAGVPLKAFIEKYPDRWGDVLGCLITHEHKDHCKFAEQYIEFGINLYATSETLEAICVKGFYKTNVMPPQQILVFDKHISVLPFKVVHNALNPVGFMIIDTKTDESLLFITDSAYLEYRFQDIDYMVVECNNIEEVANFNNLNGRMASSIYHMNLETTKRFLGHCDLKNTKKIILIHLSDANSIETRMINEVQEQTNISTSVANVGDVYELRKDPF